MAGASTPADRRGRVGVRALDVPGEGGGGQDAPAGRYDREAAAAFREAQVDFLAEAEAVFERCE